MMALPITQAISGGGEELNMQGPHQGQPLLVAGQALERAQAALVLIHGRGATAESILGLSAELPYPEFAYLAPQAADNTWYPNRFMAPIASNEPYLSSALAVVDEALGRLTGAGIPPERTVLLGFSQGACLALEFAARNARRYAGVVGLSGGLIGPDGTPRAYAGSLAGTPVFLGCGDPDDHIPKECMLHSAQVLHGLGGEVTLRLYPHMGHTINQDELDWVRTLMGSIKAGYPTRADR
jgi:predicted esterase